jgi:hypothetical protein
MKLIYFWVRSTSHLNLVPYVSYTHWGVHHTCLKILFCGGSFTKNTYICSYEYCHNEKDINSLWHRFVIQKTYPKAYHKITTWNYGNEDMNLKLHSQSFIYSKKKNEWIIDSIHLHLQNILNQLEANIIMSHIILLYLSSFPWTSH